LIGEPTTSRTNLSSLHHDQDYQLQMRRESIATKKRKLAKFWKNVSMVGQKVTLDRHRRQGAKMTTPVYADL